MKDKKCKTCGHITTGKTALDKALSEDGDKHEFKMNDDDDMKLGLLDELQESMGAGMDGAIQIIIGSKRKG